MLRGYVGDLASGTLLDPVATAAVLDAEGWVTTGDLGRVGDDGNLRLAGRVSEMYIRGGYNVYPAEVEAVLGELPGVVQVAVVGAPDPVLGEIGVAFVVACGLRPPPPRSTTSAAACRRETGRLQGPDRLHLVAELPGDPDGEDRQARAGGARRRARDTGE